MPYDDRDEEDLDLSSLRHGRDENIPNYLTQAILVTICCCWPVGIYAIVQAAKVNGLVAQGYYEEARQASDSAKRACWISAVLGLIVSVLGCVIQLALEMNRPGGFR